MAEIVNIDIFPTIEEVSLTIEPNLITVNVNTIVATGAVTSVNGQIGAVTGLEVITNKQNSLAPDSTGLKYATVDAVIAGLAGVNTNATDKLTVKLATGVTKGQAVYVSSATGTNIIVSKASNANELTSSKTLGLLETTGVTNDIVNVVTLGFLTGLNTSTATIGDPVWLGVDGALIFGLASKPFAPAHLVSIGIVTRINATVGEIFVKIQNGFELKEIHDVSVQSPNNNETLVYETATSLWKSKTIVTALGFTPIKSIIKDTVQGSTVTGVTIEVLTGTYLIPANTFAANDVMRINSFLAEKTGAVGTCTMRVKVGSTNVFSSATQIAIYATAVTEVWELMQRNAITLRAGVLRTISATNPRQTDVATTSLGISSIAFNPAIDNYIFTSLQLSNVGDSVFQSNFIMTN